MALNRTSPSSNGEKKDLKYTNAPEGENEARLLYVADLGLQKKEYAGESKPDTQQIALGFEIVGQYVELNGEKKPRLLWTKPFYIYATMGEKGKEFEYYKVFEPLAEAESVPNWEAQLGKPCNVIVKHVAGKGDKSNIKYDNVVGLSSIPAKYQSNVPPMEMKPAVGDANDPENPAQKALFGLAKLVYDRRIGSVPAKEEKPKQISNFDNFDDDIPF